MTDLFKRRAGLASVLAASVLLSGCFGDDDDNNSSNNAGNKMTYAYEVTVLNATAGQPFSPLALIAHNDQYRAFRVGEAASTDLEYLAEAGSNQQILDAVASNDQVHTSQSGDGVVGPGASQTLTLELDEDDFTARGGSSTNMQREVVCGRLYCSENQYNRGQTQHAAGPI